MNMKNGTDINSELIRTRTNSGGVSSYQFVRVSCFSYQYAESTERYCFSLRPLCSPWFFDLSHDGEYTGVGERGSEKGLDRLAQFERFGFVRIDSAGGDGVVAYFTHR